MWKLACASFGYNLTTNVCISSSESFFLSLKYLISMGVTSASFAAMKRKFCWPLVCGKCSWLPVERCDTFEARAFRNRIRDCDDDLDPALFRLSLFVPGSDLLVKPVARFTLCALALFGGACVNFRLLSSIMSLELCTLETLFRTLLSRYVCA